MDQYIAFHYCPPEEYMSYDFGPQDALDFPRRCVELCLQYKPVSWEGVGGGRMYVRGLWELKMARPQGGTYTNGHYDV